MMITPRLYPLRAMGLETPGVGHGGVLPQSRPLWVNTLREKRMGARGGHTKPVAHTYARPASDGLFMGEHAPVQKPSSPCEA